MYIQNLDEVLPLLRAKLREYLTLKFNLRSNARKFNCFAHADGDPSMHFNPRTHEETVHCFGCGWSGSIFDCAEKIDGLPSSGPEWITETIPALCEMLDIPLKMGDVSIADRERLRLLKLTQDIADTLVEQSPEDIPYISERNWDQEWLSYGQVSEESLIAGVMKKGWTSEEISKSLLVKTKRINYFGEDKLTFVIKDHRGRAIGFIYKDLSEGIGRYVNSTESVIYNKSKALLGIDVALMEARQKGLIIVEGPGDLAQLYRVGITNAAAICGTAFTEHHLLYLKALGISKVYLCLDWDKAGYAATSRVLDEVLSITSGIQAFVITAPENNVKDPDELLCKSKDATPFNDLAILPAFDWKLTQLNDESPDVIAEKMIPIIAQEPLAVRRELLINTLVEFTGFTRQSILTDVRAILDDRFNKVSQRMIATAEQALQEVREDPEAIRSILAQTESRVEAIEQEFEQNNIGVNNQLMRLEIMDREANDEERTGGFEMSNLTNFKEMMDGGTSWSEGCLISLPGESHSGKTALALAVSADIALSDPDTVVIIFSTDDDYKLIFPRLMSNIYHFSCKDGPLLHNGMIAQPRKYLPSGPDYQGALLYARDLLKDLVQEERLVVLDGEDGRTLSTLDKHLRYYRRRYPTKKLFVTLDNQFNLNDMLTMDRSVRAERIVNRLKDMCVDYKMCMLVTAEYKKRGITDQKKIVWPVNDDIADSRAQTYRPNVIAHVYNDTKARPDNTEIFWLENGLIAPRIMVSFTKNKISGRVGKIAFDLSTKTVHPTPIPEHVALTEAEQFIENKEAGIVRIQGNQYIQVDAEEYE